MGTDTDSDERLRITSAGNVGIGRIPDPAYTLDVNGSVRGSSALWTDSDINLKKDIVTLKDSLAKINQIRGVNYRWKDESKGDELRMGVIAQEVEKVFPEVVLEDNEGIKSVSYTSLVAALIESTKELKIIVERLEKENVELKKRIEVLEKK